MKTKIDMKNITNENLARFARLEFLKLESKNDIMEVTLNNLKELTYLNILLDTNIKKLILPKLESLTITLNSQKIDITKLANLKNFVSTFNDGIQLTFDICQKLEDITFGHVANDFIEFPLPKLKYLKIVLGSKLSSKDLKKMPKLVTLHISNYKQDIDNDGLRAVSGLQVLKLGRNVKVTDEGISQLKMLTDLSFCHNKQFTNKALECLKLTILDLGACKNVTDEALEHMDLRVLCLGHNENITDNLILKMKNLEILYIDNNGRVTNKILEKKYKILSLGTNKNITKEALSAANIEFLYNSHDTLEHEWDNYHKVEKIYISDYENNYYNNTFFSRF